MVWSQLLMHAQCQDPSHPHIVVTSTYCTERLAKAQLDDVKLLFYSTVPFLFSMLRPDGMRTHLDVLALGHMFSNVGLL